jgi:hypothetical protein
MYRRWKSTYRFKWTPIITYTRRHLKLLEWFEENVDPVAFVENVQSVGVALISTDLRVTVRRSEMVLESGLSGVDIDKLMPAVSGIIEVLDPKDMVLSVARSMATVELPSADYSESCARFAVKVSAPPLIHGEFRPTDGSALIDLDSETLHAQVEWGIVKRSELFERLVRRDVSRIDMPEETGPPSTISRARRLIGDQAPDVSVLVDVGMFRKTGVEVNDTESISAVIANVDQLTQGVSESLADGFAEGMGESE